MGSVPLTPRSGEMRLVADRFLECDLDTFKSLYRERTALPVLDFRQCADGALPIQL